MISHKTLDTTDILNYLTIMGKDIQGKEISQWGEGIAYALYTTKEYRNLDGYILYYIYEVVVNNMKLNHFGADEYDALLQYYERDAKSHSVFQTQGYLAGRYITVTGTRDMRGVGEEHFKEFITKYITSYITTKLKETNNRWSTGLTYQLDRFIQFTNFAVRSNMGILTEEGYREVKDSILKAVHSSIEEAREANSTYIKNSLEESFKVAETMWYEEKE